MHFPPEVGLLKMLKIRLRFNSNSCLKVQICNQQKKKSTHPSTQQVIYTTARPTCATQVWCHSYFTIFYLHSLLALNIA